MNRIRRLGMWRGATAHRKNLQFALIGLTCLSLSPALAQQTKPSGNPQSPGESPRETKLSSLLPPLLAEFVRTYGKDREVQGSLEEVHPLGPDAQPDAMRVIEQISPKAYFGVPGPVTLRIEKVRSKASARSSEREHLLIAGTEVIREDGGKIRFAEKLTLPRIRCDRGDICEQLTVTSGLILNGGQGEVVIEDDSGVATLSSGEALYVIPRELWDQTTEGMRGVGGVAAACSVSCGTGYYACCNGTTFWEGAKCKCIQNQVQANCSSGGQGSSSCSIAD